MESNEQTTDNISDNSDEISEQVKMMGVIINAKDGVEKVINELLKNAIEKKYIDSVLVPYIVPTEDSYVYLLINNPELLLKASPFAPIISVQGARALSSTTRLGTEGIKIAAIMRPCEVRAAVELSKLNQIKLDDVILISADCPGVLSTKKFIEDPKKESDKFNKIFKENRKGNIDKKNDKDSLRQMCNICDKSYTPFGDLHFGYIGIENNKVLIIQKTKKGNEFLTALNLKAETTIDDWEKVTNEIANSKLTKREESFKEFEKNVFGLDNLLQTFSTCLKCHNCMRACPIDYCQQCYYESDDLRYPAEEYFSRANSNGNGCLRFPTDSIQYHLGRMLHMSMSCVACGTCEDACPMSIPVAQIYNCVAQNVQGLFGYLSGRNVSEEMPLSAYQLEEFTELES